jgi:hypothetical protein
MKIEFDRIKNATNLEKHGLSLALAAEPDWDAALVGVDDRQAYGEIRMIALAPDTGIGTTWHLSIVARCEESSVCADPTDDRSSTMS